MRSLVAVVAVVGVLLGAGVRASADPGTFRSLFAGRAFELRASHAAIGDLDGDGDLDIVGVTGSPVDPGLSTMTVVWNRSGFAAFTERTEYQMSDVPVFVALHDVDGDEDLDAAIAIDGEDSIAIRRNDGAGAFGSPELYPSSDNPTGIAFGDLDGDGDPDMAVSARTDASSLSIRRNNGDGTFGAPFGYWAENNATALAIADFDSDDDADIVAGGNGVVCMFRNRGDGFFPIVPEKCTVSGTVLAVLDADDNGSPDVAMPAYNKKFVQVVRNYGNGVFQAPVTIDTPNENSSISSGDLDGDGLDDLIVGGEHPTGDIVIFRGRGFGMFELSQRLFPEVGQPRVVLQGDIDGDGDTDLLAVGANVTRICLNTGDGAFPEVVESSSLRATSYATGDIDGDGDVDLVFPLNGLARIRLNDGEANFEPITSTTIPMVGPPVLGDMDGDQDLDLVTGGTSGAVVICKNDGLGSFGPPLASPAGVTSTRGVGLGDVDADGDLDVCVVGTANIASILRNAGNGSLGSPEPYPTGIQPLDPTLCDLNTDGLPELIVVNRMNGSVSVRLNNGDGTFGAPIHLAVDEGSGFARPDDAACGDLDGDGDIDLAVESGHSAADGNGVKVFRNAGDGSFDAGTINPCPSANIELGDFDGDRDLDLAVSSISNFAGPYGAGILLNAGDGTFDSQLRFVTDSEPDGIAVGRFNSDRKLDLIADSSVFINQCDAAPGPRPPSCPGDIDGSLSIDASDFNILAANFGQGVEPGKAGDLNGDGLVNVSDFAILAANFGRSCP